MIIQCKNLKRTTLLLSFLSILLFPAPQASCAAVDASSSRRAEQLLQEASLLGAGEKAIYTITMEIDNGKSTKSRSLELYREETSSSAKMLVQIVQPTFLNNMKLLSIQDEKGESAWLKTSRGVKRLQTSEDREQSLFDSDFSTKDLEELNTENYRLSINKEAASEAVAVLEAEHKKQQDRRLITIDTEQHLILKVEYLDSRNQIYKRYSVLEVENNASTGGSTCAYPKKSTMEHPLEGTVTTLTVVERELPDSISPRYFNSRQL